jgi:hypothetical protein
MLGSRKQIPTTGIPLEALAGTILEKATGVANFAMR